MKFETTREVFVFEIQEKIVELGKIITTVGVYIC